MAYILIRHTVEEYDEWKPTFDDHAQTRESMGSRGGHLFRTTEDPNDLVILFEWDSLDNAREFAESDDLRETMQRAGVTDQPEIAYVEKREDVDA
ncbi:hypothetical protein [Haladaptatus sp. NG-SE-30]